MREKYFLFVVIILVALFASSPARAKGNFLKLRYEYGYNEQTKEHFRGTYNVIETTPLKNLSLGGRIITGKNDFIMIKPYLLYKLKNSLHLGSTFSYNSLGGKLIGPTFKIVKVKKKFTFIWTGEYIFNLKNSSEYKESWASISHLFPNNWKYYFELRYSNGGIETFQFRPVKIGYQFQNGLIPFIMFQRSWQNWDWKKRSDSIYYGIDWRF